MADDEDYSPTPELYNNIDDMTPTHNLFRQPLRRQLPKNRRKRSGAFKQRSLSNPDLLSGADSAQANTAATSQKTASSSQHFASGSDLLSGPRSTAVQTTTMPKHPAQQKNKTPEADHGPQEPATAAAIATNPESGPQEPATADATTNQAAEHIAAGAGLLSVSASALDPPAPQQQKAAPFSRLSAIRYHPQQPAPRTVYVPATQQSPAATEQQTTATASTSDLPPAAAAHPSAGVTMGLSNIAATSTSQLPPAVDPLSTEELEDVLQPPRRAPSRATVNNTRIELPLKPFDGNIREYPTFRNRFLEKVEAHLDLTPRHKLLYLHQYLRGEPRHYASRWQLTDANYFCVVNWLEERYGNEHALRNLLIREFANLRSPSNEAADLYRFRDEALRLIDELKQLGEDVNANHIYEHILMGRLSEKLRLKLYRNYGCDREKSVNAILDGLRRYASDRQLATSGIRFDSSSGLMDVSARQMTACAVGPVRGLYPPSHPVEAVPQARDIGRPSAAVHSLVYMRTTEDESRALIDNLVNTITELYAAATPAHAALVPVARADPLDQEAEDNTSHVLSTAAANLDSVPDAIDLPSSTARAYAGNRPSTGARPTTPTADQQTPVDRGIPAEAGPGRAASSQDDDVRVRRTNRDDSPLKIETVCFCDESTFRHFGRLLRPEVLMIPIPVPSLEDALQSVSDFHPAKEVSRVIFWFSDNHTTQLNTAVRLRLVIELSRHYATRYPTVMQYVVANPSVGSRQDIWTCGLFKLLVQMQMTLPSARLIMRPRNSRSVTHADVAALKCFLRDHYHLNLWSRYDAGVPQSKVPYPPPRSQQRHTTRATSSTEPAAAVAPDAVRPRNQRRPLPSSANVTPKDGTTNAATAVGPSCPPGKTGSQHRNKTRDGSAARPITAFPPPPSQSRFRSTPLASQHDTESATTTCSTPQADLDQERKRKPRSRSKPALLAVREPPKKNPRGKKKEHSSPDEIHHRSKDKQHPAAVAVMRKQSANHKPSKSRPDLLSDVGQAVVETAEHQAIVPRQRVCAFCGHPHCVAKCIFYRSKSQRVRRAKKLGYCFVCLRIGHVAPACPSRTTSSCQLCKKGPHHRALCPLSSSTTNAKQAPPRPSQPSSTTTESATTMRAPATKVAKNRRKPSRSAQATDAAPAAQMPPTTENPPRHTIAAKHASARTASRGSDVHQRLHLRFVSLILDLFIGPGSLESVVYLPYAEADTGLHCAYSADYGSFNGTVEKVANYFIKYTPGSMSEHNLPYNASDSRSLKQKWNNILTDKDALLYSVFPEKDGDRCVRLLSALSKRKRDPGADTVKSAGFSAFVAVKCSYDFVWYELAWRYYTAARTTSEYVLEKNGGTYKEDCGQLIFLP